MPTGQTYDKTFKQEAVRLVKTSGKSQRQIANDLGVGMSTLSRWCRNWKNMERRHLWGAEISSRKPRNSNASAGKMTFYAKNVTY